MVIYLLFLFHLYLFFYHHVYFFCLYHQIDHKGDYDVCVGLGVNDCFFDYFYYYVFYTHEKDCVDDGVFFFLDYRNGMNDDTFCLLGLDRNDGVSYGDVNRNVRNDDVESVKSGV